MPTTSLTLRERAWLPLEYVRTLGPLFGVTAERIRDALIDLHAADPTQRVVSRLDRSGARWVHLDEQAFASYVREVVTEVPPPADFAAMTRQLLVEPPGHHGVRILVGAGPDGSYVAVKISHAYGDARPATVLLREVIGAAGEQRAIQLEPMLRHRMVLPRLWWRTFGLRAGRIKPTLIVPRPPRPVEGPRRPWNDALTFESARSADVMAKLRAWRDEHSPGVTTAAITFAAFTAALQRLGVQPDPRGAMFLIDARRYLKENVTIDSNFCFGGWLTPRSLTDPASVHATLKQELASGRILTMMLLRELRIMVRGAEPEPGPYPTRSAARPVARLTYSNQGRQDILADLPWAAEPADRINLGIPTATGPEGITLVTSEINGVLHLDTIFHATTFDRTVVARALELVCAGPGGLIKATRA